MRSRAACQARNPRTGEAERATRSTRHLASRPSAAGVMKARTVYPTESRCIMVVSLTNESTIEELG